MSLIPHLLKVGLRLSLFVAILLLPLAKGHSMAKPWERIVPLHSSRSDVYDLLGKPTREGKYTATFELPNEIVEFLFAKGGSCGSTFIDSWRVVQDTVVSIHAVPKKEVLFQSRENLVKSKDPTQSTICHYSDLDEGVRYTVENQSAGELVISIDYFAASEDRYLSCSVAHQAESTPIFEQYGLISAKLENAILDNFAIQRINDPELTGKVILRRGQYSPKFAAKKLIRIKNYLFKQRRVSANRVSAFEVHAGRDFTVELYLLSKAKRGSPGLGLR